MRLNKNAALSAAMLAGVTAFDKKKDAEVETITVALPDDLATLSDEDLEALTVNAADAFAELYQDGARKLSTDELTVLGQLKDAKLALDGEKVAREALAEANAAKAAEFAAAMAPAVVEADEDVEVVETLAAAATSVVVEAPALQTEAVVTQFADAPRGPISVARVARAKDVSVITSVKARSPFRAAVNVPGVTAGADLDMDQVSLAFADMVEAARPSAVHAAQGQGVRFSQKHQIAQIVKPFAPEAIAGEDADAAIKYVTNEKNLKGGSLVASGGWCAPSSTIYDLCELESRDGLLSIPEIQVTRGGVRFTQGPDWADIFGATGFCFTEADDTAGTYNTNEVQSLTEGGAGLTSFTLTFGGQTTAAIAASSTAAQVQSAIAALSTVGVGNVYVTGPAGASTGPWSVTFINALGDTNVAQMTSTPTGGTGTLTVATVNQGGGAGGVANKPCNVVPCPTFTDVRLNVCGVCIQAGNLMNRAYPELVKRYVSGALTGHAHRMSTNVLFAMAAGSDAVTVATLGNGTGAASPVLSAIELQVEDMKYRYRMQRSTTMEAIFPFWARGVIRADLSRRQGVDLINVSDAQIDGWFRARGINAQFVYNFDNLGGASQATAWPTNLRFFIYPAGTWVRGSSDLITMSMLHDSTLNATNNFTAIFTEEGWSVMKLCHMSRLVSVAVCPNGNTHAGSSITCP